MALFPSFALLGDLDGNPGSHFIFSPPGGFHSFLSRGAKEKKTVANWYFYPTKMEFGDWRFQGYRITLTF